MKRSRGKQHIKRTIFILFGALLSVSEVFAQMTIEVTSIPQLTPLLDDIYIAGSFNDWNPSDLNFKLQEQDGVYSVVIPSQTQSNITFKFTRGTGWSTVEGSSTGSYIPDRTIDFENGSTIQLQIAGWEDISGSHTVTSGVRILDMDFMMPQLNRTRRIWVALPEGYDGSTENYPVIYLHDGQNLFDNATSFAGEWGIDESMNSDFPSCVEQAIIVGIDNGGASRIDELSPWINEEYNEGGEGDLYANFIVQTLKPFIDQNFRTRPERENTCIGGSSLGGLISMYMVSKFNDVFAKAAIFSPAFWFNEELYSYVSAHPVSADTRIFFICGTAESGSMVSDMQNMYNLVLAQASPANLNFQTVPGGQHNEYYWGQQFPTVYSALFDCTTDVAETRVGQNIRLRPNPVTDKFSVSAGPQIHIEKALIYSSPGILHEITFTGSSDSINIDVSKLVPGVYILQLKLKDNGLSLNQATYWKSISFVKE